MWGTVVTIFFMYAEEASAVRTASRARIQDDSGERESADELLFHRANPDERVQRL